MSQFERCQAKIGGIGALRKLSCRGIAVCISAFSLTFGGHAFGQSVAAFYKQGGIIRLIAGAGPGSTYTIWGQILGQYIQKHIPGNPKIVVESMPGAGGMVAANYVNNVAPQDGTVIATFSRNLPLQAFLGKQSGVRFDPREFHWLGSVEASIRACAVRSATGVKSVADLQAREVTVGGTGAGSGQSFLPTIVNKLAGTKFKVVNGYNSAEEILLAVERGEVGGICGAYPTLVREQQDELKSGKLIVLFGLENKRDIPNVPSIAEFIKDENNRQLFEFLVSPTELGLPFLAPPGVPPDRVAALQNAFNETVADPEFKNAVSRAKLDLAVTTGGVLQSSVDKLYSTPKAIVDQALLVMPAGGSD